MVTYHYDSLVLRLMPNKFKGITFGNHIFFRYRNPPQWITDHEEVHVRQFKEHGILGFLWIYLIKEWNIPYRDKTFEKEAYGDNN